MSVLVHTYLHVGDQSEDTPFVVDIPSILVEIGIGTVSRSCLPLVANLCCAT